MLVDDKNPAGRDWERERYEALNTLVKDGKEAAKAWKAEELWTQDRLPTPIHLRLIAWGWTPASLKNLE